ncbi:hypothetical protein Emag_004203 [Eimeria magna]
MKALILVGGYGTRLRPLTLSVPKPLINFCNRSIVEYQVASFKRAGVDHLILAVAYQPDALIEALRGLESKYSLRISCSKEDEPLGTAGPIRLAKPLLLAEIEPPLPAAAAASAAASAAPQGSAPAAAATPATAAAAGGGAESISEEKDCFFVCNSDVICSFPLEAMWAFHKQKGAEATILEGQKAAAASVTAAAAVTAGAAAAAAVIFAAAVAVAAVAAGVYILSKKCIDRIPLARCSIEKELFPQLAAEGCLFCFHLQGYWADIGQPKDFLEGMSLYLQDLRGHRDGAPQNSGVPLTGGPPEGGGGPTGRASNSSSPRGDEFSLVSMPSQEMGLVEGPNIIGNVLVVS